jgi:hypothetical protein
MLLKVNKLELFNCFNKLYFGQKLETMINFVYFYINFVFFKNSPNLRKYLSLMTPV